MIESVGTKFFKSITETADDLEDADTLALEFISLSSYIKIVLFMLIILLLLIIFKYLTLGTLFLKNCWLRRHTELSKMQFLILAAPMKTEMESTTSKMEYDSLTAIVQLQTIISDGQFLLKPLKGVDSTNS
ncbi:hypothetical protein LOAG_04196 [Loa loa]|uniref:Uncharacterized protein n=1 Tax=Loa loa TaxID=7209 RepID=A0A1S0U2J5_LOALO|nr:hypothetical protein LOAG_04196 [Loa loa]EFO24288.1 hypothetical protein LOAG_04196 [Loa loa]